VSESSSVVNTSSVAETAESISALTSLNSTDESSGSTMAERMAQQFEQKQNASQGVVAFKQRQQKRKEYMEQAGQVRVEMMWVCCQGIVCPMKGDKVLCGPGTGRHS
jgi:uncharacterized protein YchJ